MSALTAHCQSVPARMTVNTDVIGSNDCNGKLIDVSLRPARSVERKQFVFTIEGPTTYTVRIQQ